MRQWEPQPVWQSIGALSPHAFIFLGDNVYSDVGQYATQPQPKRIATAYTDLSANKDFQAFRQTAQDQQFPIFATWDDHDYGLNDGGADYPHRLASKQYFMDFFGISRTSSGDASQPGIYQSYRLQVSGLDVHLILLDTRSFRSGLKRDPDSDCSRTHFVPNLDNQATILGKQQWTWLEQELRKPADLRLIASSIQLIPTQHCFEKWANFPRERERFFRLIKDTRASGVVLISGDRHMAEISKLPADVIGYPLYEVTSSGLNSALGLRQLLLGAGNNLRVGSPEYGDNFGGIAIEQADDNHLLKLQIFQADGTITSQLEVPLSVLSF